MDKVRVSLVGGFLGAGKTTLLQRAAHELMGQGLRVALITNDQAPGLVDTALLGQDGFAVSEVSGGCFCCRFDQLVARAERVMARGPVDLILGEPVGSCTDLSATVLQPLKRLYGDQFQLLPYVVVLDPARAREALRQPATGPFPDSVYYIFRKQIEEADAIAINKIDSFRAADVESLAEVLRKEFPAKPVLAFSARTGAGLDAWFAYLQGSHVAGGQITSVDYDLYAEGEAALGWLNAQAEITAPQAADWPFFCSALLGRMQSLLRISQAEIAHIKLLLTTPQGSLKANLTGQSSQVIVGGSLAGRPPNASLLLNARVHTRPDDLLAVFKQSLQDAAAGTLQIEFKTVECFSPAWPQPTHRYAEVQAVKA